MNFSGFEKYAMAQDSQNKFSHLNCIPDFVPRSLHSFYQNSNPIDVEVNMDEAVVHFYPINELEELQSEYVVPNGFVFATCNGDPIFLADGIVYTYPHGVEKPSWEQLDGKIAEFFAE